MEPDDLDYVPGGIRALPDGQGIYRSCYLCARLPKKDVTLRMIPNWWPETKTMVGLCIQHYEHMELFHSECLL